MEFLCAEAANCTRGEERARTLLESIRQWVTAGKTTETTETIHRVAVEMARRAIFELETRAVEVDALLEDPASLPPTAPFISPSLATLEALGLEANLVSLVVDSQCVLMLEAANAGDATMVDLLITHFGVDPTTDDNRAIRAATANGHLQIVDRLLQDPRVDPSIDNNLLIRTATANGHLQIVDRLLQDSRVDPSAEHNSALRCAASNGYLQIVDRLLQDSRVDPSNCHNYAIKLASLRGHIQIVVRLLQDSRVDPSTDDNYALRAASKYGHLEVVDHMLRDERVNASAFRNNAIHRAIAIATSNLHISVVKRLQEAL